MRLCAQTLPPPHSLHSCPLRRWRRSSEPPHSLHLLLMHLCWQILAPPFLASASDSAVRTDTRSTTVFALSLLTLMRTDARSAAVPAFAPLPVVWATSLPPQCLHCTRPGTSTRFKVTYSFLFPAPFIAFFFCCSQALLLHSTRRVFAQRPANLVV